MKYILFIILGILIFIFFNNYNTFSIGVPEYLLTISNGDINIVLSDYSDDPEAWAINENGRLSPSNPVIMVDENRYYVFGNDIDDASRNYDTYIDILQTEAIQIAQNLIERIRPDELDLSQNYDPFIEAIKYTLTNQNTPLFYTASRFYLTIVHLLRNGNITDLTLNDSSAILTPGQNSSIRNSIISGSICICNTDWNESASFYYFHRNNKAQGEISSRSTKDYIKSIVSSEYHSIIDGLDENILFSRVLIILEPINDFDSTLQNNVLLTTSWGDNPRETNKEEIIQKNQNLSEWSEWRGTLDTANQVRILYDKNVWKSTLFLSKEQSDVLDLFSIAGSTTVGGGACSAPINTKQKLMDSYNVCDPSITDDILSQMRCMFENGEIRECEISSATTCHQSQRGLYPVIDKYYNPRGGDMGPVTNVIRNLSLTESYTWSRTNELLQSGGHYILTCSVFGLHSFFMEFKNKNFRIISLWEGIYGFLEFPSLSIWGNFDGHDDYNSFLDKLKIINGGDDVDLDDSGPHNFQEYNMTEDQAKRSADTINEIFASSVNWYYEIYDTVSNNKGMFDQPKNIINLESE